MYMSEELARGNDLFWTVIPNYVLLGYAEAVETVGDALECKLLCLSETEFECVSGEFYPDVCQADELTHQQSLHGHRHLGGRGQLHPEQRL